MNRVSIVDNKKATLVGGFFTTSDLSDGYQTLPMAEKLLMKGPAMRGSEIIAL